MESENKLKDWWDLKTWKSMRRPHETAHSMFCDEREIRFFILFIFGGKKKEIERY